MSRNKQKMVKVSFRLTEYEFNMLKRIAIEKGFYEIAPVVRLAINNLLRRYSNILHKC